MTNPDGTTNYDNQANELIAKNLKGKLLLAHGTMDNNVPPDNTLLVVNALIAANKDFDLLMLPNRKHGFANEPYMFQAFIQHTSASLCINENADPTVRIDFEMWYHKAVPENDPEYKHNYEGPDDMPAHLKASMLGSSVLIPISNGSLSLGMWQGIYLGEHRDRGGRRNIVITVWGE